MKWNKEDEDKLRRLYSNKLIPIKEIIKVLKRSPASIHNKISRLGIKKTRSPRKFRFPQKTTPALARIHAHICGDGNLFKYREKDCYGYLGCYKPDSYRERCGVGYTNMNQKLIREFMEDIKSTFFIKPLYYNNYVKAKSKDIFMLLKDLGAGRSKEWFISTKIMNANKEIKKNWIRAFFDDEACFDDNGRIRVRSVNRKGIIQVIKILKEFLPSHITPKNKYYPDGSVYLNINKSDAGKYFSRIGSLRFRTK